MHDCSACNAACYCDMEDAETLAVEDCCHACEESENWDDEEEFPEALQCPA